MRKYRDIKLDSDRELEDELMLDEEAGLQDIFAEVEETDVDELEDMSGFEYDDTDSIDSENDTDFETEEEFVELVEE